MQAFPIMYDGWPLVYQPNDPAALHLLTLLEHHPVEFPATIALPGDPAFPIPPGIMPRLEATSNNDIDRMLWEQISLPRLAQAQRASLVHRTAGSSALFGSKNCIVSPAGFGTGTWFGQDGELQGTHCLKYSLVARLRESLVIGGMSRVRGVLWPADLSQLQLGRKVFKLPPLIPKVFWGDAPELSASALQKQPQSYILYHGPHNPGDLRRLLDAWSWASKSIAEYYPLLLLGLDRASQGQLETLVQKYGLKGTLQVLPPQPPVILAALYHGCSALFHPAASSPWGGPIRLALACGKPVVALEDRLSDALTGSAAYLVPPGVSWLECCRALGAALVTLVVEESVAKSLSRQARQRAAGWRNASEQQFSQHLRAVYQVLAAG